MRYYDIKLTSASGANLVPSSLAGSGLTSITSLSPTGGTNPAALNVEFDLPSGPFHLPTGNAYVRVWGLGLKDLSSAFDLNGANIGVSGGMAKGLPLANPSQARLLVQGTVNQAFGNWQGTDQTLDLIIVAGGNTGKQASPINLVLNWSAGQTLASALSSTFQTAFPNAKQKISISPRLTQAWAEPGYYNTLTQLATYLNGVSKAIVTDPGYSGVKITYDGTTVTATDSTAAPGNTTKIAPQDLIGQPTWIDLLTVQVKTVMRGDIALNDAVTLPATLVTTSQGASSQFRNQTTFTGDYTVTGIHHYGNFRQPDAASWNTTFTVVAQQKAS